MTLVLQVALSSNGACIYFCGCGQRKKSNVYGAYLMELAVVGSAIGFAIFRFLDDNTGGSASGFCLLLSVVSG